MSKTTKIIAALGVVAGLGVAALPAFTYAVEPISGNADVIVEVEPAIAMTITGNNDGGTHETAPSGTTYGGVDVFSPSTAGGSVIDGHTTPATPTTTVSSSWTSLLPNKSVHGTNASGTDNGFYSTINVYTNNTSGYTLAISGTGSENALGALTNIESGVTASIPATGIVKAGTAGWGYVVDTPETTDSDSTATYDVAAATIKTVNTKTGTASGDRQTIVFYGVSTDSDQATGTYSSRVTYTATCQ